MDSHAQYLHFPPMPQCEDYSSLPWAAKRISMSQLFLWKGERRVAFSLTIRVGRTRCGQYILLVEQVRLWVSWLNPEGIHALGAPLLVGHKLPPTPPVFMSPNFSDHHMTSPLDSPALSHAGVYVNQGSPEKQRSLGKRPAPSLEALPASRMESTGFPPKALLSEFATGP